MRRLDVRRGDMFVVDVEGFEEEGGFEREVEEGMEGVTSTREKYVQGVCRNVVC